MPFLEIPSAYPAAGQSGAASHPWPAWIIAVLILGVVALVVIAATLIACYVAANRRQKKRQAAARSSTVTKTTTTTASASAVIDQPPRYSLDKEQDIENTGERPRLAESTFMWMVQSDSEEWRRKKFGEALLAQQLSEDESASVKNTERRPVTIQCPPEESSRAVIEDLENNSTHTRPDI